KFPNTPTLEEIGCQDFPANGMILVGPKGLPDHVVKKVGDAFKKVSESAAFQAKLDNFDLPYDYKDRAQLEKDIPVLYESGKTLLNKLGLKKEGEK
ncbi:MAG TPA: tripartite tricarboxylate transporter substrate-binding protein, partial [Thermodesulfobacteriota bacterium]|nr:tripartite tricarboxylate transporter substrate-binding protein [Thermodesulfobacteriota bacterium]